MGRKNWKKFIIIASSIGAIIITSTAVFTPLTILIFAPQAEFKKILRDNKSLFHNSLSNPIKQTDYYQRIKSSASRPDCLTLFIGYDGVRTDAVTFTKNKPNGVVFSSDLKNHYISNSINKDTMSGPGWTTIFTGKWDSETGEKSNGTPSLNQGIHTLQYETATAGINTAFYGWKDTSWTNDFESLPADKQKYLSYNHSELSDKEIANSTIESIESDCKFVTCIFNDADSTGHNSGFIPSNPKYIAAIDEVEDYARMVVNAAKEKVTGGPLDIIMSTDHGGWLSRHGGTRLESRTTWFADNFDE